MNSLTKSRYFELVTKDKILNDQGTSLYRENKVESLELSDYYIVLEEQVFYENRFQYADLIRKYIDGEINCYTFQWDFSDLYYDHLEIADKIKGNLNQSSSITFSIDSKKENFFSLVDDDLIPLCNALDEHITEERFDQEIKRIYSDIQKYTSSTSEIYNENQVLRSTMIFFTVVTTIVYCFLKPELYSFFSQFSKTTLFDQFNYVLIETQRYNSS